jgi:hypothetical protein
MSPRDVEGDDHVDQMATDSPLIRWDSTCEEVGLFGTSCLSGSVILGV